MIFSAKAFGGENRLELRLTAEMGNGKSVREREKPWILN